MDTILTVFAVASMRPYGALLESIARAHYPAGTYAIMNCREVLSTAVTDHVTQPSYFEK